MKAVKVGYVIAEVDGVSGIHESLKELEEFARKRLGGTRFRIVLSYDESENVYYFDEGFDERWRRAFEDWEADAELVLIEYAASKGARWVIHFYDGGAGAFVLCFDEKLPLTLKQFMREVSPDRGVEVETCIYEEKPKSPRERENTTDVSSCEELRKELQEVLKEFEYIDDLCEGAREETEKIWKCLDVIEKGTDEKEKQKCLRTIAWALEDIEDALNEIESTAEVTARSIKEEYFSK